MTKDEFDKAKESMTKLFYIAARSPLMERLNDKRREQDSRLEKHGKEES